MFVGTSKPELNGNLYPAILLGASVIKLEGRHLPDAVILHWYDGMTFQKPNYNANRNRKQMYSMLKICSERPRSVVSLPTAVAWRAASRSG